MGSQKKGKGRLSENRIPNPIIALPESEDANWGSDPSIVHHRGVHCDGPLCEDKTGVIQGIRYKCLVCHREFCGACASHPSNTHDEKHELLACRGEAEFVDKASELQELDHLPDVGPIEHLHLPVLDQKASNVFDDPNEVHVDSPFDFGLDGICVPKLGTVKHHQDPRLLVDVMLGKVRKYQHPKTKHSRSGIPETRIMDLQPGNPADRLQVGFRSIRPRGAEPFDALYHFQREETLDGLSSCAGATSAIYVGDHYFLEISNGLMSTLRALRYKDVVRPIWIYELCSDQHHHVKANENVPGVGSIYRNASQVIVWMAEEDEHTQNAFELIEQLAYRCACEEDQLPNPEDLEKDADLDLPDFDSEEWSSLYTFFERAKFPPALAMEESNLARHFVIKCGRYELEWWKVQNLAKLLAQPAWEPALFGAEINMALEKLDELRHKKEVLQMAVSGLWRNASNDSWQDNIRST